MSFIAFLIVVLFLLAITDLIVGVSNDAVNFLNSAIGSRVASVRIIILVASAGVVIGSVFSSGIMEIARTGIFNPGKFTLSKLLMVFTAVMITDIILLDVFNTLGLPTSTTVSVIFELLGASFVAGLFLIGEKDEPIGAIASYINAESIATIVSGIFLSILVAFTLGTLVQYISRLLFSFEYEKGLKRWGAIFAGIGITAIVYFLLLKGLKGTTLLSKSDYAFVQNNLRSILLGILLISTLINLLLQFKFKINPLKTVVMMGTFSLAMAFAGNDLVNFIGVPITGFLAYQNWKPSGTNIDEYYMDYLASNDVVVPTYMLLAAGAIMALTLWFSSKARRVTETEVKLGSQHEGDERFQPNAVSRQIVKTAMLLSKAISVILPTKLIRYYDISFKKSKMRQATIVHDKPAFDLVRASVNLVLASMIIALATSLKLPLSTTYVSFMVAMGTSLADKAWGRETAVYRVAGVLSVIGGWLITAFMAFCASALFAFIIIKGGSIATVLLMVFAATYLVFSHRKFDQQTKTGAKKRGLVLSSAKSKDDVYQFREALQDNLYEAYQHYNGLIEALINYNDDEAAKHLKEIGTIAEASRAMQRQSLRHIRQADYQGKDIPQLLIFSSDLLEDLSNSLHTMAFEIRQYISNLHAPLDPKFIAALQDLKIRMNSYANIALKNLVENNQESIHMQKVARDDAREFILDDMKKSISLLQMQGVNTRQALLHNTILLQSRDMVAITNRVTKLFRQVTL